MVGAFSQYGTTHQNSCIKVADDLPLEKAVLLSCGVPTGWGSAVYAADVQPGETVIISGIGGIGINAVQGARYAGAANLIAVDPLQTLPSAVAHRQERARGTHPRALSGRGLSRSQAGRSRMGAVATPETYYAGLSARRVSW